MKKKTEVKLESYSEAEQFVDFARRLISVPKSDDRKEVQEPA